MPKKIKKLHKSKYQFVSDKKMKGVRRRAKKLHAKVTGGN